jgi:Uma2 family endonuclease
LTLKDSEPEPDGAVVRGRPEDYLERHPVVTQLGIVCEVADRSLAYDRGWKKRMYASNGAPVYWIANLKERVVEVYSDPAGNDYRQNRVFTMTDNAPIELDGNTFGEIRVAALFGK